MRRRSDEGGVTVLVAVSMTVLLLVAAFAVDLGMQRVARRDMQALSDIVALDLSREMTGHDAATVLASTAFRAAVKDAVARNDDKVLGSAPDVRVEVGRVVDGTFTAAGAVSYATSSATVSSPSVTAGSMVPNAVRVTASNGVDFAFATGRGEVSRAATASLSSFACYKLGSWATKVDTGDSALLDPVLRKIAEQSGAFSNGAAVAALSYTGLATAAVDLTQLAVRLGVGSVDQLATTTVTMKQLLVAVRALAQPASTAVVNVLDVLVANASSTVSVQLGKLVGVSSGAGSMAGATANLLDLVGGAVSAVNGTNLANVHLGAGIPGLANVNLRAKLVQGPRQYCGAPGDGTTIGVASDTEQLGVHVDGTLAPTTTSFVPPVIEGLLENVVSAQITAENHVAIDLSVAGTSSRLKAVTCGQPDGIVVDVENGVATLSVRTPLRARVGAKVLDGSFLGLPSLAEAVIAVDAEVLVRVAVGANGHVDVRVDVPPRSFDTPYDTGSGSATLQSVSRTWANISAHVGVLGGLLGAGIYISPANQTKLLDAILTSGLTRLFDPANPASLTATLLDPLLALAGARVGGSDVVLDSRPALSCSVPKLVG
ncbi:pilus assembly protein TadG-related protein [Nocardioides sp. NPDC092400]|uniref:pilus assembly protein TadG-related protein n=1 Tax=Nocardioides sp. NPDC092400 TaxID=3155196 RepID=UPI00343B6163